MNKRLKQRYQQAENTPDILYDNKDFVQYMGDLKNILEADFLMLDEKAQTIILDALYDPHDKKKGDMNIEHLLDEISLPSLWALELLILKHLDETLLLRRAWLIREKFKSQFGESIYRRYQDSLHPSIQDTALKELKDDKDNSKVYTLLRDDVQSIARQMQRQSYNRIRRNQSISERKAFVVKRIRATTIAGILIFSALSFKLEWCPQVCQNHDDLQNFSNIQNGLQFLLLIMYSGIAGTAISLLQRIEKVSHVPPSITDSIHDATNISMSMSDWYIRSLIVCGAIFALLIHVISLSGLVNLLGVLPNESSAYPSFTSHELINLIQPPNSRSEMAKLLLACFLSGFAERLVPDILDTLAKKTEVKPAQ